MNLGLILCNLGTKITSQVLISNEASLQEIVYLDIGSTLVSDLAMALIKGMKHLKNLNISATRVTDEGVVHLAGKCCKNMKSVLRKKFFQKKLT